MYRITTLPKLIKRQLYDGRFLLFTFVVSHFDYSCFFAYTSCDYVSTGRRDVLFNYYFCVLSIRQNKFVLQYPTTPFCFQSIITHTLREQMFEVLYVLDLLMTRFLFHRNRTMCNVYSKHFF